MTMPSSPTPEAKESATKGPPSSDALMRTAVLRAIAAHPRPSHWDALWEWQQIRPGEVSAEDAARIQAIFEEEFDPLSAVTVAGATIRSTSSDEKLSLYLRPGPETTAIAISLPSALVWGLMVGLLTGSNNSELSLILMERKLAIVGQKTLSDFAAVNIPIAIVTTVVVCGVLALAAGWRARASRPVVRRGLLIFGVTALLFPLAGLLLPLWHQAGDPSILAGASQSTTPGIVRLSLVVLPLGFALLFGLPSLYFAAQMDVEGEVADSPPR